MRRWVLTGRQEYVNQVFAVDCDCATAAREAEAARRKEAREAAGEEGGKRLRKTGQEADEVAEALGDDVPTGKKPKVAIEYDDE